MSAEEEEERVPEGTVTPVKQAVAMPDCADCDEVSCDRRDRRPRRPRWKKVSRSIHKLLGIFVFVPLMVFTVTGVMLNHREELGLQKTDVTSPFIMRQYNYTFEDTPREWKCSDAVSVVQWNNEVVLESKVVEVEGEIIGAVAVKNGYCIATEKKVYYYSSRLERIEALEVGFTLPEGVIQKIGVNQAGLLVLLQDGKQWRFAEELLDWEEEQAHAVWSEVSGLAEHRYDHFKAAVIGRGLPLERVVLDFHSGNIFGLVGKVLVDAFAIGIVGLSFSGMILLKKTKRRRRDEEKRS